MIKRYSKEGMEEIWSPENKWIQCTRVEWAVLMARKILGEIKTELPEDLALKIDPKEIDRIEKETKQDVIAFLMHTSSQLPAELRQWWHHKMTSYDIIDNGLSLQMVDSVDLLENDVLDVMKVLKAKAFSYKDTPQIGRTHGVHAEPITFGVKFANWYAEFNRDFNRLKRLKNTVAVGKISGAVGMYTLSPEVEEKACEILGLKPIIATQIISRDIIAEYLATLAIIGGTIGKIGVNFRTLQRTEILEAQEFFGKDQRGSSAMPHKRNPIGSENLSGMARVLHGYAQTAFENQNTWDERDIANSGPERIILPDASILLDYMLKRLKDLIENLIVYPEKMAKNLWLTKGLIFSQDVQALVAEKSGLPREEAYKLVQEIAQYCWDEKLDFLGLLESSSVTKYVTPEELRGCFDLDNKLKHVDYIFRKVFGAE